MGGINYTIIPIYGDMLQRMYIYRLDQAYAVVNNIHHSVVIESYKAS